MDALLMLLPNMTVPPENPLTMCFVLIALVEKNYVIPLATPY